MEENVLSFDFFFPILTLQSPLKTSGIPRIMGNSVSTQVITSAASVYLLGQFNPEPRLFDWPS